MGLTDRFKEFCERIGGRFSGKIYTDVCILPTEDKLELDIRNRKLKLIEDDTEIEVSNVTDLKKGIARLLDAIGVEVYDNGGKSFDRYTVIVDEFAFAMSENALSPRGVNTYIGTVFELHKDALGRKVKRLERLPEDVLGASLMRWLTAR